MIKIEPNNLIKLIQKQLDQYPEPEIRSFDVINLRGELKEICSNLHTSKFITLGPDFAKLTSNVNNTHIYITLVDENMPVGRNKENIYQIDYARIDICEKMKAI